MKIKAALCLMSLAMSMSCYGQHIEEIRKKLYPSFDRVQWSQQYTMEQDFTPVDYSQGAWSASLESGITRLLRSSMKRQRWLFGMLIVSGRSS
jgi:hypothetical protein